MSTFMLYWNVFFVIIVEILYVDYIHMLLIIKITINMHIDLLYL